MERLAAADSLLVRQQKEMGEILTGFEQRNKYLVTDPAGGDLFVAVEEGGSTLARLLLRNLRPFRIRILGQDSRPVLELQRPYRWFFHEIVVSDTHHRKLGRIQRRFAWARRIYSVFDATGRELYRLYGPILHPWTFEVRQGERVQGRIVKKWSGLAKEGFTDADNFGITFPQGVNAPTKALLLGAVFLIDFVHFEKSG
jgi:uncharacterized protein YxjI